MATEIANAYVAITTKMPDAKKDIAKGLGGEATGRKAGKKIMAGVKKAAKIGAIAAAGSIAVLGGAAFKSAAGIETAKKTLKGLYGDTKEATKSMSGLRKVAKDSPIDYQAYLKSGEAMAYLGIKSEDATGIIKNMGKAIVGFGGGSEEMDRANDAITRMASEGKVTKDTLSQLSNTGVPIFDSLAESLGVSNDELSDMVTKGKVGLDDVTDALSNPNLDAMQKAIQAGEGAGESFANTWKKVKDNVVTSLGEFMVPMLEKLKPLLQKVGDAVGSFIDGMKSGEGPGGRFMDILRGIRDTAKNVVDFVRDNMGWIGPLAVGITAAAAAFGAWTGAIKLWQTATKIATGIQVAFNAVMAANPIMLIVMAIAALVAGLVWFFTKTEVGKKVWAALMDAMKTSWDWVVDHVIDPLKFFFGQVLPLAFQIFKQGAVNAWNAVKGAIGAVWDWIKTWIINPIVNFFTVVIPGAFKFFKLMVTLYINAWKTVFTTVWHFIRDKILLPVKTFIMVTIPNAFKKGVGWIIEKWELLKLGFKIVWDWIKDHIFNPVKKFITETIPGAFKTGVDSIKKAWEKIKNAAKKPVNFVIDTVYNKGIRKLWNPVAETFGKKDWKLKKVDLLAQGGRVGGGFKTNGPSAIVGEGNPAYPEYVIPTDPKYRKRALALAGSLTSQIGSPDTPMLASGGILGWIGDKVKSATKWAGEVAAKANPFKWIWDKIKGLTDGIGSSRIAETVAGLPKKIWDAIKKTAAGIFGGGKGGKGKGTKGMGWKSMWDVIHSAYPGLTMTSNYRPGAMTVNGTPSYHGAGRAVDVIPASMATFRKMKGLFPNASELIYTPAGNQQLLNGQPFAGWSAAVKRQHYNHVHVALEKGGILGGYASGTPSAVPGWSWVGEQGPELMRFRGGEQVASARRSARMHEDATSGRQFADTVNVYAQDPDEAVRKLQQAEKRRALLSAY